MVSPNFYKSVSSLCSLAISGFERVHKKSVRCCTCCSLRHRGSRIALHRRKSNALKPHAVWLTVRLIVADSIIPRASTLLLSWRCLEFARFRWPRSRLVNALILCLCIPPLARLGLQRNASAKLIFLFYSDNFTQKYFYVFWILMFIKLQSHPRQYIKKAPTTSSIYKLTSSYRHF